MTFAPGLWWVRRQGSTKSHSHSHSLSRVRSPDVVPNHIGMLRTRHLTMLKCTLEEKAIIPMGRGRRGPGRSARSPARCPTGWGPRARDCCCGKPCTAATSNRARANKNAPKLSHWFPFFFLHLPPHRLAACSQGRSKSKALETKPRRKEQGEAPCFSDSSSHYGKRLPSSGFSLPRAH